MRHFRFLIDSSIVQYMLNVWLKGVEDALEKDHIIGSFGQ